MNPKPLAITVVKARKRNFPKNKNVFARIEFSKNEVYEGQPIQVKQKIYVRGGSLNQIYKSDLKEAKGVWTEQKKSNEIITQRKVIDGSVFTVYTCNEFILFPQQSGEIEIGPWEVEASMPVSFFQERKVSLQAPTRKLKVKKLPSGVSSQYVGDLTLSYDISDGPHEAGNPIDVKIKLSGTGNFSLLNPDFLKDAPEDIDIYDPKVIKNYGYTSNGMKGKKEWQYILMPNLDGLYTLPAFSVKTFNPSTQKTANLSFPEQEIQVGKGIANTSTVDNGSDEVSYNKKDIDLKQNQKAYLLDGEQAYLQGFIYSYGFIYTMIACLLSLLGIRLLLRTSILQNWMNKQKAWNEIAALEQVLKEESESDQQMIDDILSQYFSNLLKVSKSQIIWDYINEQLKRKNIPQELISKIKSDWDQVNLSKYTGWTATQKQESVNSLIQNINELNKTWS